MLHLDLVKIGETTVVDYLYRETNVFTFLRRAVSVYCSCRSAVEAEANCRLSSRVVCVTDRPASMFRISARLLATTLYNSLWRYCCCCCCTITQLVVGMYGYTTKSILSCKSKLDPLDEVRTGDMQVKCQVCLHSKCAGLSSA